MSVIFKGKKVADRQKLRGGYYTPEKLTQFLCDWSIRTGLEHVLEPSVGDGNFVVALQEKASRLESSDLNVTAVEIDVDEISKARKRVDNSLKVDWINDDFFSAYNDMSNSKFDVVLGNPPFIRFQYFENDSRELAFSHLNKLGYKPTKLANCWAAFVQLSIDVLAPNGRIAMVLPAELLQVKYASELRERITQSFEHVVIVTFKKLVFPEIQQEVVLLLAEGKRKVLGNECDVHTVEILDDVMMSLEILEDVVLHSKAKHARPGLKWTSLFLSNDEFSVLDNSQKSPLISHLRDFASVDVGIVTGRNSFFVVTNEVKSRYDLSGFVIPLVGKTSAINSIRYTKEKHKKFSSQYPGNLLSLKEVDEADFSAGLQEYINLGEAEGVNSGYKCRIRKKWYEVPSTHLSNGFLFRQIHRYPLLVSNMANAACTDTIHRVTRKNNGVKFEQICGAFVNSLTFAWSEVCGRSYGGGVLELEPNESEELPIPYFDDVELDLDYIDQCTGDGEIEKALDYVDVELLINRLGLSHNEVALLRSAWIRLRDRRINRKLK